jgi:hypothetical protein
MTALCEDGEAIGGNTVAAAVVGVTAVVVVEEERVVAEDLQTAADTVGKVKPVVVVGKEVAVEE